jgi:tetratricopeptide (TPR) repeat protein
MDDNIYIRIENYLDNTLTEPERAAFETELQTDPVLAQTFATIQEARERLTRQWADEPADAALLETLQQAGKEYFQTGATTGKIGGGGRTAPLYRMWWAAAAAISVVAVSIWFLLRPPAYERLYAERRDFPEASFTARNNEPAAQTLQNAATAFNSGNYAQALPLLNTYRNDHPTDAEIHLYAGICYLELKQYDRARAAFQQITATQNIWAGEAYWYTALAYLRENNRSACAGALREIPNTSDRYQDAQTLLRELE